MTKRKPTSSITPEIISPLVKAVQQLAALIENEIGVIQKSFETKFAALENISRAHSRRNQTPLSTARASPNSKNNSLRSSSR